MQVHQILEEIDKEIARLQAVRNLLAGETVRGAKAKKAGKTRTKRRLTPEGRKRIAEAMRRRWAERKKQQAGKAK